jgi:hypothetical protein
MSPVACRAAQAAAEHELLVVVDLLAGNTSTPKRSMPAWTAATSSLDNGA